MKCFVETCLGVSLPFHLRVRHGQREAFLREIEHVEDGGHGASVLAMVDGSDHLDDGFPLVYDLRSAVLVDDGQFALHQHAVVHHGMVMPVQLLPDGKDVLLDH